MIQSPPSIWGRGGYLTYDGDTCQIYRTQNGKTTLFAGNGTCGDTGDGGPANDAAIDGQLPPLGTGLQVDDAGNVLFDEGNSTMRRIDPSGIISTIPIPHAAQAGMAGVVPGDHGDEATYLNGVMSSDGTAYEIHRVDAQGRNHLVVSYSGHGASDTPASFVKVGPDHWVALGWAAPSNDVQVLIDFDGTNVTTTDLTNPSGVGAGGLLLLYAADAEGNLYGASIVPRGGGGYSYGGNRVIRVGPDGSTEVIAGTGTPDPETGRQMGMGADLDLSARAVSVTRQGNLLISSGHVVYRMADAAGAPAIS